MRASLWFAGGQVRASRGVWMLAPKYLDGMGEWVFV